MDLLWLCAFAWLAGFVDSIAGGGGLIQLPALFLLLPPAEAAVVATVLGTNKLSSICGTGMAVVQYGRRIRLDWPTLLPSAVTAFLFSFLGARVVSLVNSEVLRPMVLVLLIASAVYTFVKKDFGGVHAPRLEPARQKLVGAVTGGVIGFYDGFFGPGTGSFLIFVFIGVFGFDFLIASASAKVVNFSTNLSAVLYFAATDRILYGFAVPMGLCNVLGSMMGTRLAILKGNKFVRVLFLVIVTGMIARFGWDVVRRWVH